MLPELLTILRLKNVLSASAGIGLADKTASLYEPAFADLVANLPSLDTLI